ncbi:MAG: efflux RND transporter periplasmic adaptor subunit [Xanthomonadaceae bacterium]|nr:efflux RND transporter periplasmic adaptor subunit [Xanthomonadaceae bacterium]
MRKKLIIAIVVSLLAGAAFWKFFAASSKRDNDLVLYGNVDIRQISLAFTQSERVTRMDVEEGDLVKVGQVLAALDTRALNLQIAKVQAQVDAQEQALLRLHNGSRPEEIAQARAQTESARAQADLAGLQLQRLRGIRAAAGGGRAISQQELDDADSQARVTRAQWEDRRKALRLAEIGPRPEDIAQAESQLQAAHADLELLRHYLSEAELKAPQDATVRARLLEPGDMASPQRPAYTLAITDPKWIRAYVNGPDLGRIRPGMPARVTTDSHPDQPIGGQIGYISSVAEFTPKTVQTEDLRTRLVYEIRVWVRDPDNRLRLGMPATVRIAIQDSADTAGARQ